jgi:hypothetical protein
MKTWQRSPRRLVCGRCCGAIQIGDPMLILHSPEHGWKKCRCRECAGEAVPELPELVVRTTDLGTPAPSARVLCRAWR